MPNRPLLKLVFYIAMVFACAGTNPPLLAAPVTVPGTSVSMQPPAGFTVTDAFSGFYRSSDNSSITIAELPAEAFAQLSTVFANRGAAEQSFATKGITITNQHVIRAAEQSVSVLSGSQRAGDITVGKHMALLKGDKTVLVTFNVMGSDGLDDAAVSKSIQSIKLGGAVSIDDKLAQLPFAFEVSAPFRVLDTLAGSGVLLTTLAGKDPTGNQPIVVIVRSLQSVGHRDLPDLSQQLLNNTKGFDTANITVSESADFAGGEGHMIHADASGKKAVQYLRVANDGRYVRLFASGSRVELDALLPTINQIAQSVVSNN